MDLLVTVVVCCITLALGLMIVLRDPKRYYARLFVMLCVFIIVWCIANYLTNLSVLDSMTLDMTNKLAFASGFLVVYTGLLFTYNFPKLRKIKGYEKFLLGMLGAIGVIVSFLEVVVGRVVTTAGGIEFTSGAGVFVYLGIFIGTLLLIVRNLTTNTKRYSHAEKNQSRLILGGFVASAVVALSLNVVIPLFTDVWHTTLYGPLAVLILVAAISYSIVRHGLFDIRLAVMRSVAYGLSLMVLAALYYCLAYIASFLLFRGQASSSIGISPVNILLALILAFLFQPIKSFFDHATNKIFFRNRYSTDAFYTELSKVLAYTTRLQDLLQDASRHISKTLRAEHAGFYITYDSNRHVTAGTPHHARMPLEDARSISEACERSEGNILVTDLMTTQDPAQRLLRSHNIAILLPLRRANELIGFLMLGPHLSAGYTSRDLRVLETIMSELVVAIENALSLQKVRDINANLEQRIAAATAELRTTNARLTRLDAAKDEFLSIASHQLRTPLTSVKGYLSMVLEGDMGKVPKAQQQVLSEAFASSERMVHLIHDFLNVSRLQTGKFALELSRVDLLELVKHEVKSLEAVAKGKGITLKFVDECGPCDMQLDETKLQQVVMNFIDNAIFYSHTDSTVTITLKKTADAVEYTVRDTGIGVPKAEQSRLFEKFFRASNARKQRPDGTGVGIFLAKTVIDAHGGKIIFHSQEGVGSTFGFRLPLKKSVESAQQ